MSTMIFVNLPVKDLPKSKEFFAALGYSVNPQFTDDNAACLVVSDQIFVMLLTEPFFRTFTGKTLADTGTTIETITCLSAESRQAVDEIADRALAAGARSAREPEDHGFMYGRSFEDLDGHVWEYVWMDPAAVGTPQE